MKSVYFSTIIEKNKTFYDRSWAKRTYVDPRHWPHWELILKYQKEHNLEIGPGIKPKIPINHNYFIDISQKALDYLKSKGGYTFHSDLKTKLPFKQNYFDLACAFEVLEHVPSDHFVLKEIHRILKQNGIFLISFPLHRRKMNMYDDYVGHMRRYEPNEIETLFKKNGFNIISFSKVYSPWPGKWLSRFILIFVKLIPGLVSKMLDLMDKIPNVPIQNRFEMKKWTNDSSDILKSANTGIFILQKN